MVYSDTSHRILSRGVKDPGARLCLECQEHILVLMQDNNIKMSLEIPFERLLETCFKYFCCPGENQPCSL